MLYYKDKYVLISSKNRTQLIQRAILTPLKKSKDDPFILTSFGLTPVKSHFNPLNGVISK